MPLKPRLARTVALVKAFEVFEPTAVRRPDGGWTIGYGHTRTAREGASVSREDAEALLAYDLMHVAQVVERDVAVPIDDRQMEALTAFAFNVGWEAFRRSTVLERLNAGDQLGAAQEIERWRLAEIDGATARLIDALVRRRAAEKVRFLTPSGGFPKTSTPQVRPTYDSILELPRPSPFTVIAGGAAEATIGPTPPPFAVRAADPAFSPPAAANESVAFPTPRPADEPAAPPASAVSGPTGWERRLGAPRERRTAYVALGLVGAALFLGSMALILTGRPSAFDLALGLVGVLCMAPAVYTLASW